MWINNRMLYFDKRRPGPRAASGPEKIGTTDSGIVRIQNATSRYFILIYLGIPFDMQPLEKGCDERNRRCKNGKKGGRFEAE